MADQALEFTGDSLIAVDVGGGRASTYGFWAADDKYYVRRSDRGQVRLNGWILSTDGKK